MSCCKRFFCCKTKNSLPLKKVYILHLTNNKYYVGESINPQKRIKDHFNGRGSTWTKINKPLSFFDPLTLPQENLWELTETLRQMNLHGIDNVRGSLFTNPTELSHYDKVMAAQLFCELNNLCRKCGDSNHFAGQCISINKASWVYNFGGSLTFNESKSCIKCGISLQNKYSYMFILSSLSINFHIIL